MKVRSLAIVLACVLPSFALADSDTDAFVEANVLATLYHELGHALIDIEAVPIFGQEEDAADVLSVLLIDAFFEEDDAVALAYDTASAFSQEAQRAEAEGDAPAYWDVHGPDEQRYFNTVCLFYGANPEERDDVAADLGLPEERAESCPDEFDLANASWGAVLDDLASRAGSGTIITGRLDTGYRMVAKLITDEVGNLDADFGLGTQLTVNLESCGEANAFYDPETKAITICTEFVDYLEELAS